MLVGSFRDPGERQLFDKCGRNARDKFQQRLD
jgi:hypothetical protein